MKSLYNERIQNNKTIIFLLRKSKPHAEERKKNEGF